MNLRNIKKCYFLIVEFLVSLVSFESIKEFFNDDFGGLVLPFSGEAINDEDWLEYQRLEADKTVKSINPDDLPSDFCDGACRLVDEFRQKTVNEEDEWMLYFDYTTADIIYCFKGIGGKTGGTYEKINFKKRKIASLHNHPKKFYSFPSHENFEILEKDFEDYELICSDNNFWIIESKGILDEKNILRLHRDLHRIFCTIENFIKINYSKNMDVGNLIEELYSEYLLSYLNTNYDNIMICKREYR